MADVLSPMSRSVSPHGVRRKPPPTIDLTERYPSPNPKDPFAPLSVLRGEALPERSGDSHISPTSALENDEHLQLASTWYEVYSGSQMGIGYVSTHAYRGSSNYRPLPTPPISPANSEPKKESHYKRRSATTSTALSSPASTAPLHVLEVDLSSTPPSLLHGFTASDSSASNESISDHGPSDSSTDTSISPPHSINYRSRSSSSSDILREDILTPLRGPLPASTHSATHPHTSRRLKRVSATPSVSSYATVSASSHSYEPSISSQQDLSHMDHPVSEKENSGPEKAEPVRRAASTRSHRPYMSFPRRARLRSSSLNTLPLPQSSRDIGNPSSSYVHIPATSTQSSGDNNRPENGDAETHPTLSELRIAASLYVVAENGLRVSFGDLCSTGKTIVCFTRHLWCLPSQEYISSLSVQVDPVALARCGVKLIIICNGSHQMIKSYRQMVHTPFEVYSDPSMQLYNAMCLGRLDPSARQNSHRSMDAKPKHGLMRLVLRAARAGMLSKKGGGDTTQLGGEFIFEQGIRTKWTHRMKHVGDHTPVSKLFSAAGVSLSLDGVMPAAAAALPELPKTAGAFSDIPSVEQIDWTSRQVQREHSFLDMQEEDENEWMQNRRRSLERIKDKKSLRRGFAQGFNVD